MNKLLFDFQTKKADDGGLIIEGWANPSTKDRMKEVLNPKSWKLENYKKNPVILFDHGQDVYYGSMPIGKALSIEAKDGGLYTKVKISGSKTERITAIRDLIEEGILKAFSVGFDPGREESSDGGKELFDNELLEISVVPIPMHQDALGVLSRGISPKRSKSAKRWFSTFKKRYQKMLLENVTKTDENGGKLQLIAIEIVKNPDETLEKASKRLKSFGYMVDDFIENDNSIKFKQTNIIADDCAVIKVNLDMNTIAHLKGKEMPIPKDQADMNEEDKIKEEDKACGDKKKPKVKEIDIKAVGSMIIQSLVFDQEKFSKEEAAKWLEEHGYQDNGVDETEGSFRYRQREPGEFDEESFRTIEIKPGIIAVIGKMKEEEKEIPQDKEEETEGESKEDMMSDEEDLPPDPAKKGIAPGTPIPTGADAVPGNENPMLDLLKQNNVLMGTMISEQQKTNEILARLVSEPIMDYNESDTVSSEMNEDNVPNSGQASEKSINSEVSDELNLQVKAILRNQDELSKLLNSMRG
jgi:HK97 family phage prohead protease